MFSWKLEDTLKNYLFGEILNFDRPIKEATNKVWGQSDFTGKEKAEGIFGGRFYPKTGTSGTILKICNDVLEVKWDTIEIAFWCGANDVSLEQN